MYVVPDGLPTIDGGGHSVDDGRACVMEYISVISGDRFSAEPECTEAIIGTVAICLNDHLSDIERSMVMVPFIGRLMGTRLSSRHPSYRPYLTALHQTVQEVGLPRTQTRAQCGCSQHHHQWAQELHTDVARWMAGYSVSVPTLHTTLTKMLDVADRFVEREPVVTNTAEALTEFRKSLVKA